MLYRGSISWLHQHVSIVKHYYDYDVEVAKAFEHTVTHNNTFTVFCNKKEIATAVFNNNHYICSRKQDIDLGTVCPHILVIKHVPPEGYTHEMFSTDTFRKAFKVTAPPLPNMEFRNATPNLTTNQQRLIKAIMLEERVQAMQQIKYWAHFLTSRRGDN